MKTTWKPVVKVKNKYGQPRSFLPKGRTHQVIYVVCVRDHPGVVKIGRTSRWLHRRRVYANWNLSNGEAITHERTFCLTDEFIDLEKLEAEILSRAQYPLAHGYEWFRADFDDVCRFIDATLLELDITYL
jgi:hypothetical protein